MSKTTTPDGSEMVTPVKMISMNGVFGLPGVTLIGLSSGGDFTTTYASATTITLGTAPYTHTYIAADIVTVQQYDSTGACVNTYSITDTLFSVTASVLTVTGATFAATDTFIVITNIPRSQYAGNSISDAPYGKVNEISPARANVLDEEPFSAQAADGDSTGTEVLGYSVLGFEAQLVGLTGTLTFWSSNDGSTKLSPLRFMKEGTEAVDIVATTETKNYGAEFVGAIPKYIIVNLASRTVGSVSVQLHGRGV